MIYYQSESNILPIFITDKLKNWILEIINSISFGFLQDTANKQTDVLEFNVKLDIDDSTGPVFDPVLNPTIVDVVASEPDGTLDINKAFCNMLGWSEKELLNMTVFDVTADKQDTKTFTETKTDKEGVPVEEVDKLNLL